MASVVLESEFNRVREFYRLTGYTGDVQFGDVVVGAWRGNDLVGVVRIATEEGVRVLRGMRVLPEFQRQGIGTEILVEIRLLLNGTECFAIAYAHLKDFYGRIGFRDSNEQEAPAFLRLRINKYRADNPQQTFILIRKVR